MNIDAPSQHDLLARRLGALAHPTRLDILRHLAEAEGLDVIDVEIGEAAAVDVDTPEAMSRAGGVLQG